MLNTRIGTISSKRAVKQLLTPNFEIDQRSFSDVMNYIVTYLKKINFYTAKNETNSTWNGIENGDSILFMTTIITTSMEKLNHLETKVDDLDVNRKEIKDVVETLIEWDKKIESWRLQLVSLGELDLANSIQSMQSDILKDQLQFIEKLKNRLGNEMMGLSRPTHKKVIFKTDGKKFSYALHTYKKIILNIKKITVEQLQLNFYSSSSHAPQSAMYIAFCLLLQQLQKQINDINSRHLDFYYKDILIQKPNNGIATNTVVTFNLLPNVSSTIIEEGTQLSAGKLFGVQEEILFTVEKPIVAYQIELAELQTLYLQINPFLQFGTEEPLISSISKSILMANGQTITSLEEWYLFGANKKLSTQTAIDDSKVVELGCIISSQVLQLSEGQREISIRINYDDSNETVTNDLWSLIDQISKTKKMPFNVVFSRLFDEGFELYYTTSNGWEKFPNYVINCDRENNALIIDLALLISDVELTVPKNNAQNLRFPAIKICLNNYAPCYLYSFVNQVSISTIDIQVNVKGVKNLALYNNIGIIPAGKPFDLFGPMPALNSYLMVGKSELFQKQVSSVAIHIDWDNLPADYGGFENYYAAYSETFLNNTFKVSAQALVNYNWTDLCPKGQEFNLFNTDSVLTPEGYQSCVLNHSTVLSIDNFNKYVSSLDNSLSDPLLYSLNSSSGFIKFNLAEPSFGFGMDLYQKDFSNIAMYNAKNKTQLPFPNKPFVPKVATLSLSYSAKDLVQFDATKQNNHSLENTSPEYFHITPFGIEALLKNNVVLGNTFFYNLASTGYLYLGLKGVTQTMTITLFFDLLRSSTTIDISDDQTLRMDYFELNKWTPFKSEDILVDGTNKLIKSGIIELVLHKYDSDLSELYWIRISTKGRPEHYPKIKGIYFNAVEVSCTSEDPLVVGKVIPMGSISKFTTKQSNIKQVIQPQDSSGGKVPEDETELYTKTSERLRHKNRAVSIWDYERLVLERFNDIKVAKCTNLDESFKVTPGRLKIVLLSQKWTIQERYYYGRNYLDQVQQYLQQKANAFTKIEVINPSVEALIVNACIEFMPEDNGGYYLNLLNSSITDFLSPSVDVENGSNGIGDIAIPSKLENYIEKLPYIKSVKSLRIEHIIQKDETHFTMFEYSGSEVISTTTPWSILCPIEVHKIKVYEGNTTQLPKKIGLNDMIVGLDFIVGKETSIPQENTLNDESKNNLLNDSILLINTKLL